MSKKRILIIDEAGFSRVCSAILEFEGYSAEVVSADREKQAQDFERGEFGLVITSYPYGVSIFKELKMRKLPTMVLSDHVNEDLVSILDGFEKAYCMIKPIDYQRFTALVKRVMNGELSTQGGFNIV